MRQLDKENCLNETTRQKITDQMRPLDKRKLIKWDN